MSRAADNAALVPFMTIEGFLSFQIALCSAQIRSDRTLHAKRSLGCFYPVWQARTFPVGTPVLTAARQLGVDLDSVCGGRGICSKCQITRLMANFPNMGSVLGMMPYRVECG